MLFTAKHKFARIASSKVRPFADLIRGLPAEQGLNRLRYLPNRGARMLEKVLKSAMANAEQKNARNPETLLIREARVDDGPMFKRLHARARGMAYLIQRKFCHIIVGVDDPSTPDAQA